MSLGEGKNIPRVLLIFEYGTLNGGERSMLAVLPQFVGTDFEFVVLAPSQGPLAAELAALGIPVLPSGAVHESGGAPSTRLIDEIRSAAVRVRPDLIHGNSLSMGRLTGTLSCALGTPSTAHLRDIIGLSQRAVEQLNANRALVAVSQAVRDFHASQGVDPARTHVVYNGIDGDRFSPPACRGSLREELRLPIGGYLVAAIGQICLRKGLDLFAKAAVLAASQIPEAHFLLIGERHSEKAETVLYDKEITAAFAVAGLESRFHRLGYRSDVEWLLPQIDLVVHCARQEPFGRVLLEAAAAERPLIATKVGGTEEMLSDGQSAILVPPDMPAAIADAMVLLHGDGRLAARLATAARERVATRFTSERAASELAAVWRKVL